MAGPCPATFPKGHRDHRRAREQAHPSLSSTSRRHYAGDRARRQPVPSTSASRCVSCSTPLPRRRLPAAFRASSATPRPRNHQAMRRALVQFFARHPPRRCHIGRWPQSGQRVLSCSRHLAKLRSANSSDENDDAGGSPCRRADHRRPREEAVQAETVDSHSKRHIALAKSHPHANVR